MNGLSEGLFHVDLTPIPFRSCSFSSVSTSSITLVHSY